MAKFFFVGLLETVRKDTLGSQLGTSSSEYVKSIYPTGTDESDSLMDVTDATPIAMSCSPTRDYVGYLGDLRLEEYGKILIRSLSTEAFTGLNELELLFDPKIKSFDWSADGNTLVYCTTAEVRTRGWNDFTGATDTLVIAQTDLEFVSWKYGGRIAFVYTASNKKRLSLIYADGTRRTDLAVNLTVEKPQISSAATNEVFGTAGGSFVKVDVTALTSAEVEAGFTGILPRLSPDASKATYSKSGEDTGVYILYMGTTATEEAIK
ncbi:hypothetical protein ACFL31_04825 [Candidatus Margulisiibacteriota bacterium]